jgi:hypothetical protein
MLSGTVTSLMRFKFSLLKFLISLMHQSLLSIMITCRSTGLSPSLEEKLLMATEFPLDNLMEYLIAMSWTTVMEAIQRLEMRSHAKS